MHNNDIYALHKACKQNNYKTLIRLLRHKPNNINLPDAEGMTPLLYACSSNSHKNALLLLINGANPHSVNNNGLNAISFAAQKGNRKLITLLLQYKIDPNIIDKEGYSPLYYAYINTHLFCLKSLLENGATVSNDLINCIEEDAKHANQIEYKILKAFYETQTKYPTHNIKIFDTPRQKGNFKTIPLAFFTIKLSWQYKNSLLTYPIDTKHINNNFINSLLSPQNMATLKQLLQLQLFIYPYNNLFSQLLEEALKDKKKYQEIIELLIRSEYKDIIAANILRTYCKEGDIKRLDFLVSKYNISVDYKLIEGIHYSTPLLTAIENKKFKLIQYLLDKKADPNKAGSYTKSPLYALLREPKAYEDKLHETVKLLLNNNANINYTNVYNSTALYMALSRSYFKIAKLLLSSGAHVNILNLSKSNALHYVCNVVEPDLKVVELIIKKGCNVNQLNISQQTPIYFAISKKDSKLAELLLKYGAVVTNDNISLALKTGHAHSVQKLFYNIKCYTDLLLDYSTNNGSIEQIKESIQNRAQILIHKEQLLINATNSGNKEFVRLLLEDYRTSPNIKDSFDISPLFKACYNNNYAIAFMLLEHGAKVNMLNTAKNLSALSVCRDIKIVKTLVARGADVLVVHDNKFILNPSALYDGNIEVARFLVSKLNYIEPCIKYVMIAPLKKIIPAFQDKSHKYLDSILISLLSHSEFKFITYNNTPPTESPYIEQLIKNYSNYLSSPFLDKIMTFLLIQRSDDRYDRPYNNYVLPRYLRMKILHDLASLEKCSILESF